MPTLALDYGTSNTAAAWWDGGVRRLSLEEGETLPTAVFFPPSGPMRIGAAAGRALVDGEEGRYMRALKSALGLPLLREERLIGGRRRSLAEVTAAFLAEVKARSERAAGVRFDAVLSGRPARFHADPEADARAERDLRDAYADAGFGPVAFLPEPEAAARAVGDPGTPGFGLVVDIGGGTSDFAAFRAGDGVEVLVSHGIRLGGTDFDHALSMARAMPLLGLGGRLRREMGPGWLPVPRAPYVDLSTWARIPFLYGPDARRMAAGMAKLADDAAAMGRLATVLEDETGHDVAFAVERGKIAANADGAGRIDLSVVERGLGADLDRAAMDALLDEARAALAAAARETLARAEVAPGAVDRVVLVGGSSLMGFVEAAMRDVAPSARMLRAEAFTAVVDGLALASR